MDQLINFLIVLVGVLLIVWQMDRQHKSNLEIQKENHREGLRLNIYKELKELTNKTVDDTSKLSSEFRMMNIDLTFGCEEGTFVASNFCGILTPYDYTANNSVITSSLTNRDDNSGLDVVAFGQGYAATDSTIPLNPDAPDRLVYATWTVTPVPLPAALWLFATGLLGLIGVARRKKA